MVLTKTFFLSLVALPPRWYRTWVVSLRLEWCCLEKLQEGYSLTASANPFLACEAGIAVVQLTLKTFIRQPIRVTNR